MKLIELLNLIDDDTIVCLAHLDAQNIGHEFPSNKVPGAYHDMTVCEISADGDGIIIIVC